MPSVREELSLVDNFTIEILVIYLESLAMAHEDEKSLGESSVYIFLENDVFCTVYELLYNAYVLVIGTQSQCIDVISHLERIIVSKSSVLLNTNKKRRVPRY